MESLFGRLKWGGKLEEGVILFAVFDLLLPLLSLLFLLNFGCARLGVDYC